MADREAQESVENVLQGISRHLNCLVEENRNTRKRAIQGISKGTIEVKPTLDPDVLQGVLVEIIKPVLKLVSDPTEKCRELTILFLSNCVEKTSNISKFLPVIIPVLVQRLGQQELTETSEEMRLELVQLSTKLIKVSQNAMFMYLDDMIRILQRTIIDPYPEVKKESCKCACQLALATKTHFHMQSEALIKPLVITTSHQHSRVRVEALKAIGDVIQYGNGKSVDDVVSHLAQRLFDESPVVRSTVTKVVGHWLLDLTDRYSFHHKLIPLLLTSTQDEMPDIQELAETLWHDIGLKFQGENEEDLKDKIDFTSTDKDHYPKSVERPNLGCRELIYRNFSKILAGLVRDLTDWVVNTRIKSAQLLYVLMLNEEDNVTQHLEKVLSGLYKAAGDEEKIVVQYVVKTGELIGYFVQPEVWCKLALVNVKSTQSAASVRVLAAILHGSRGDHLKPFLQDISNILSDPAVCQLAQGDLQIELLNCVSALLSCSGEVIEPISQEIFNIVLAVIALHRHDSILSKGESLLEELGRCEGVDVQGLYKIHSKSLLQKLKEDCHLWTQHSTERFIFETLLLSCGPLVGELLDDILPMFVTNLGPDKDAEVCLKVFNLLSRLVLSAPQTIDSTGKFADFTAVVVKDMIQPNLVWKAGRTASAIRTTAVSCLWALLQSSMLDKTKLVEMLNYLITQLRSLLEDDNKQTRLITCRVIGRIFSQAGKSCDQDFLHNMYPDFLKRLDDSSDDIRVAMCKTFVAYFDCFKDGYEVGLYRAHLEAIYKGLLVHLDDPEQRIQDAVYEVLLKCGSLMPSMLLEELDEVRLKHRSTKYIDNLETHFRNLSTGS